MDGTLAEWFSTWQVGIFLLALGLCVGSFLNVCICRLPAGKSLVRPRSHCTSCEALIAWYDNIPVASYFILRGRCRKCGARFSARYMLVELATGLIWFGYWLAYFKAGAWFGLEQPGIRQGADHVGVYLVHMALASALVASGVIDYDLKEVYTSITNFALAVGLVASLAWPEVQRIGMFDRILPNFMGWEPNDFVGSRIDAVVMGLVGAAVGAGIINVTRFLGTLAFRREAMGIGDVYLMAAIGGCLGWEAAVLVFLAAPFLGLPYGIWQVIRARKQPQEGAGEEPAPPKPCLGTFLATVAGFVLLAVAAATARPEWGAAQRLMLVAALASFGISFLFLRREEEQMIPLGETTEAESAARLSDAREVPYGPFLGMAAGVVMLVQDYAVGYFQPGLQAMWHAVVG